MPKHLSVVVAAVLLVAGCQDDGLVNISGQVSFDGEPIADGTIGFFPEDGKGPSAEAVIIEGRYSLALPTGQKNVVIHAYEKVGEHFPWGQDAPPAPIVEELLPAKFHDKSELKVEIEEGSADFDFELTSA